MEQKVHGREPVCGTEVQPQAALSVFTEADSSAASVGSDRPFSALVVPSWWSLIRRCQLPVPVHLAFPHILRG